MRPSDATVNHAKTVASAVNIATWGIARRGPCAPVDLLIMIGAMAFIVLLMRIANPTTAWERHVQVYLVIVPMSKNPHLKNARVYDAHQTLNAKPLMESVLVSPDTAVNKQTVLQQTWLCQKGVKVCNAPKIRTVKPTIASLDAAKRSISHRPPPRPRLRPLHLFQTHHQLKLRFQ